MKITKSYLKQVILEELSLLNEKCWPGYTQKGMKTMFGKRYPNCVKKKKVNEGEVVPFGTLKQKQEYRSVFAEAKKQVETLQKLPRASKKRDSEELYKEKVSARAKTAEAIFKEALKISKYHLQNIANDKEKMHDFYKEFYYTFMKSGYGWPDRPARLMVLKDRATAYFDGETRIPIERIFANLFPSDSSDFSPDVDNLTRVLLSAAGVMPDVVDAYIKAFFKNR
jgi:hypothetical protein